MYTRIRSPSHTCSLYAHLDIHGMPDTCYISTHACVRNVCRVLHLHRVILLLACSSTAPLQAHAGQAQSLEAGCHGNDFADNLRLAIQKSLYRSHPARTCVHLCLQTTVPKEMQGGQNHHNSSASQSRYVAMSSWCFCVNAAC